MGRSGGGGSRGGGMSHSSHSSSVHSHSSHSSSRSGSSFRTGSSFSSRSGSPYRRQNCPSFEHGQRPAPVPVQKPKHKTQAPRSTVIINNTTVNRTPSQSSRYGYTQPVISSGYSGPRYPALQDPPVQKKRSIWPALIAVALAIMIICIIWAFIAAGSGVPASTVNRQRLTAGSFTTDCVTDNTGWLMEDGSSEAKLGSAIQQFWDKTGIQPYIVLEPYDSSHDTPDERFDWADQYYLDNIGREDAMLLVYFDDEPDGDWEMVCGTLTGQVLDNEAKDIIWGTLDRYWNDLSYTVPQALENGLNKSAERMMVKTASLLDIVKAIAVAFMIIITGAVIITIMKTIRQHGAEKAAETERILSAPLENAGAKTDPLVEKYHDN